MKQLELWYLLLYCCIDNHKKMREIDGGLKIEKNDDPLLSPYYTAPERGSDIWGLKQKTFKVCLIHCLYIFVK